MLRKSLSKINAEIALVIVLGFFLRVFRLGAANLWRDEAFTVQAAKLPLKELISLHANDTAPPLHTIIIHYWIKVFSASEFSVRFPSLIFGIGIIYIVYLISKSVFNSKRGVLLATIFAALNPVLIFYSQEARNYSLFAFLSILSLYLSMKLFDKKNVSLKALIPLTIVTTLGLFTNNLFLFVAFVNFLLLLGNVGKLFNSKISFIQILNRVKGAKRDLVKVFISYFIAWIIFLPWFILMLKQLRTVESEGFWLSFHPIHSPVNTLIDIYNGLHHDSTSIIGQTITITLSIIGIGSLLYSTYITFIKKKANTTKQLKILAIWFWACLLISWIFSFVSTPVLYIRYMSFLVPIAVILSTYPLLQLFEEKKSLAVVLIFIIMIGNIALYFIDQPQIVESKAGTGQIAKEVDFRQTDQILHTRAYTYHSFNYYSSNNSYIYTPKQDLPFFEGLALTSDSDFFTGNIHDYNRIWVIYSWPTDDKELAISIRENYEDLVVLLRKQHNLGEKYEYPGQLFLELWEK